MPKIIQLSSHVADLIAAGEVVERPASVIKELVENAIDSGARIITVEIKSGGMTYMRVTDDGCGMAPQDAVTAFKRHATSKLRDESGLEAIGTLGFRGEALAAISAVSHMELMTREKNAAEGTRVLVDAGKVTQSLPAGCPEGTTMIVRDLFFNTPARLKFMKTDRAEGAAVTAAVLRCALSHPEISIKYIKDGKQEYHTSGDGRTDSCIYSVFGREFASGLVEAATEDEYVGVTGYVSSPKSARGNRANQYFFVNGRHVKSKTLQAALEQAYKNSLFTGKYPACVLYITVSPGAVDVNVHPAKTEVRFLNEKRVFDGVYYAALGALEADSAPAELKLSRGTRKVLSAEAADKVEKEEASPVLHSEEHSGTGTVAKLKTEKYSPGWTEKILGTELGAKHEQAPEPKRKSVSYGFGGVELFGRAEGFLSGNLSLNDSAKAYMPYSKSERFEVREPEKIIDVPVSENIDIVQERIPKAEAEPEQKQESEHTESELFGMPKAPEYKIIGEAMNTYIIVEREDSLWLIDKHAAHERIHFDRLKSQDWQVMAQQLLTPVICRVSPEDAAVLEENRSLLESLGFEADGFGENAVAIRQIPSDIDIGEAASALEGLCTALRREGADPGQDRLDGVLHTIACKAAIKAGRSTDMREVSGLVEKVLAGEIKYCPHGRPVAVELTKTALDKSFKRI